MLTLLLLLLFLWIVHRSCKRYKLLFDFLKTIFMIFSFEIWSYDAFAIFGLAAVLNLQSKDNK